MRYIGVARVKTMNCHLPFSYSDLVLYLIAVSAFMPANKYIESEKEREVNSEERKN